MGGTVFIWFESWAHQINCLPSQLGLMGGHQARECSWMEMPRVSRLKLQDLERGDSQGIKFVCKIDLFSVKFWKSRSDRVNWLPVATRLYLIKMHREPWVLIRVSIAVTEYNNQKQLGEIKTYLS